MVQRAVRVAHCSFVHFLRRFQAQAVRHAAGNEIQLIMIRFNVTILYADGKVENISLAGLGWAMLKQAAMLRLLPLMSKLELMKKITVERA